MYIVSWSAPLLYPLQAGTSEATGMCYSSGPSGQKLQCSEVLGVADPRSQWSLFCCKVSPLDQCDIMHDPGGFPVLMPWEQENHIHAHNVLILVKVNSCSFLGRNNHMESTHHEAAGWSSESIADWFLAPVGWMFSISFGEQNLPWSSEFTYSSQPLHHSYCIHESTWPLSNPNLIRDCCCVCLNLWLSASDRIQTMIGNSDLKVTSRPIILLLEQGHAKTYLLNGLYFSGTDSASLLQRHMGLHCSPPIVAFHELHKISLSPWYL